MTLQLNGRAALAQKRDRNLGRLEPVPATQAWSSAMAQREESVQEELRKMRWVHVP